jgi:hypothetical protein
VNCSFISLSFSSRPALLRRRRNKSWLSPANEPLSYPVGNARCDSFVTHFADALLSRMEVSIMVNSENTGVKDAEPLKDKLDRVARQLQNEHYREKYGTSPSSTSEEVQYEDVTTEWHGARLHVNKRIVTLVKMPRFEGKQVTIFPRKFPVPVICSELCGKVDRCNLRENGFSDLCKHSHLLGTLVKASPAKFRRHAREERAPVIWVKSSSRSVWLDDHESNWKTDRFGNYSHYTNPKLVPHTALVHERTEDSTFAAYSSQEFLDTYDDPEDGHELEYTMYTGMVSLDKSQAGAVSSFMYRTTYRDRRILLGFETKRVEKTYVDTERRWIYYPPYGRFIFSTRKVVRTTSYMEDFPVYKWIRLPTLRPIGCYLKPMKVIGSATV